MIGTKGFSFVFFLSCSRIYVGSSPLPEEQNLGIAGGQVAAAHSAPFMVHIILHSPINSKPLQCGGTVLSENYVLTALHCVYNINRIERAELRFGVHNVSNHSEPHRETRTVTINSSNVFLPSDPSSRGRDLAIIKLDNPVPQNDHIKPIELPPDSESSATYDGETLTAYGWGILEFLSEEVSDVLRTVKVPVFDFQTCKNRYDRIFYEDVLRDYHLCTSGMNGDTCTGDSGGPLMIGQKQVAVVSFGSGCKSRSPSVNVKLAPHLEWIRSVIGKK